MTRQYDGVRPVVEGTLAGDTWTTTAVNVWEGPTYYSPLASRYLPNGGGAYNYLADGLGSTRQLMSNATHAITDTYVYDAFGDTLAATGSTDNPYRYVGGLGYRAGGGGMMQLGARYYAPALSVFTSRDPDGGMLPGYVYCDNRPTTMVDPDGRNALVCVAIADPEPISKCCLIAITGAVIVCTIIKAATNPCRERERIHNRCKRAYIGCVKWCDTLGYPTRNWRSIRQCKQSCNKARRTCENLGGDTSVFPND